MSNNKNFVARLDPVTFEVVRNALITIVDQMAEQVMRTCYSFVVYNRDFSNSLLDAEGNTVSETGSVRGKVSGTFFHMIAEAD